MNKMRVCTQCGNSYYGLAICPKCGHISKLGVAGDIMDGLSKLIGGKK